MWTSSKSPPGPKGPGGFALPGINGSSPYGGIIPLDIIPTRGYTNPMAKKRSGKAAKEGGFVDCGAVKVDAKHRVVLKEPVAEHYKVYRNDETGEILLDPQVMIPAREAWLWKNKEALASLRRGIKQAAEGKVKSMPSLAKYADDELE